jgi:hypothetical protein
LEVFEGDTGRNVINVSKEVGNAAIAVVAELASKKACIGAFLVSRTYYAD